MAVGNAGNLHQCYYVLSNTSCSKSTVLQTFKLKLLFAPEVLRRAVQTIHPKWQFRLRFVARGFNKDRRRGRKEGRWKGGEDGHQYRDNRCLPTLLVSTKTGNVGIFVHSTHHFAFSLRNDSGRLNFSLGRENLESIVLDTVQRSVLRWHFPR
jgi:hypothetical protein